MKDLYKQENSGSKIDISSEYGSVKLYRLLIKTKQ